MSTTSSTKTPEKTAPPTSRSTSSDTLKAQGLHVAAGTALTTYAVVHRIAQDDAEALRVRAVTAQTEIDTAQIEFTAANTALRNAEDDQKTAGTPIPDQVTRRFNTAKTTLATRQATLKGIQDELPGIVSTWNTAAATAESAITTVIYNDDVGDGFWDNHGSKIASWVSEWAGRISEYAGYAALLLAWVPVLGQFLVMVTLIAGIAALIADMALYINGEGSLVKVLTGLVSTLAVGAGLRATIKAQQLAKTALKQGSSRWSKIAARSKSPVTSTTRFNDLIPTLIRTGRPNTWFHQGWRSFDGLRGKAWVANFFGHTNAAWAAQSLKNAEKLSAKFAANSVGGYKVTLNEIWDESIINTVGANGMGLISVNTFRVIDHFSPSRTPLPADEILRLS